MTTRPGPPHLATSIPRLCTSITQGDEKPRLLNGIRDHVRLELIERREFNSDATMRRYRAVS